MSDKQNNETEKTVSTTPTVENNEEVRKNPLNGLAVEDGIVMVQLVDRAVTRGMLSGQEALPVGILRQKIMQALGEHGIKDREQGQ
mgnify:CR=1 FL=1|tara:strand:- start:3207 stop:3464 length:258 start_codon:yes stop_codon:yes gene_type:complete